MIRLTARCHGSLWLKQAVSIVYTRPSLTARSDTVKCLLMKKGSSLQPMNTATLAAMSACSAASALKGDLKPLLEHNRQHRVLQVHA